MDNIYKGSIPGVAYSQFEYKWDSEWFVKFLKELEEQLVNIPTIFALTPDDATKRLMRANNAIKEIQHLKETCIAKNGSCNGSTQ